MRDQYFLSFFDVLDGVNGDTADVIVPSILRIISARVIYARRGQEKTTFAGVRTKRKHVRSHYAKRWVVTLFVSVV